MMGFGKRAGQVAALCAALFIAMTGAALAQSASAQAFVEGIYKPYLKKDFKGTDYSRPAYLRRTFEPVLAGAIIKDTAAAAKRMEVPTLDGDPFLDAQDWEISDLVIDVKTMGSKATAMVKFTNIREPRTIMLDLVKTSAGWRIADITSPSGSLRKLFKL